MKERGILFTKENRAGVRSGVKTQTRRTSGLEQINENPDNWIYSGPNCDGNHLFVPVDWQKTGRSVTDCTIIIKPRHVAGDHLYLQEPYQIEHCFKNRECCFIGKYLDDNIDFDISITKKEYDKWCNRKKPYARTSARYMYKSLARDWVEVTGVRCEQVQDISGTDITAEGIPSHGIHGYVLHEEAFEELWDSINAKRGYGWEVNPFVWVYEFKKVELA